jgi:hypothetical protein
MRSLIPIGLVALSCLLCAAAEPVAAPVRREGPRLSADQCGQNDANDPQRTWFKSM